MKKLVLFSFLLTLTIANYAQAKLNVIVSVEDKFTLPISKFSNVTAKKNVLRYSSSFTNVTVKGHIKLSEGISFSVNSGIYNHGMIHNFNDSRRVKQRAYVLPLGGQFTFGQVKDKNIFVGGEFLIPFHYKEKTWIDGNKDTKIKFHVFGSNRVESFIPVVFLGVQYNKTTYIQFKYQLGNFLNPDYRFDFRGIQTFATQSNMIELSFGTLINADRPGGKKKPLDESRDVEISI
jgi:hypothetical protein